MFMLLYVLCQMTIADFAKTLKPLFFSMPSWRVVQLYRPMSCLVHFFQPDAPITASYLSERASIFVHCSRVNRAYHNISYIADDSPKLLLASLMLLMV